MYLCVCECVCFCAHVLAAKILCGRCTEVSNLISYEWFHTVISFAANVVTVGKNGVIERDSHPGTPWLTALDSVTQANVSPNTRDYGCPNALLVWRKNGLGLQTPCTSQVLTSLYKSKTLLWLAISSETVVPIVIHMVKKWCEQSCFSSYIQMCARAEKAGLWITY